MSKQKLPKHVEERIKHLDEAQKMLNEYLDQLKDSFRLTPLQILRMLINSMIRFHKFENKRQWDLKIGQGLYDRRLLR